MNCCRGTGARRIKAAPALGGLTMHVNKVSHRHDHPIASLRSSAKASTSSMTSPNEMEPEDGVIWVYGLGDLEILAFTDFGVENLVELIKIHKEMKSHLER